MLPARCWRAGQEGKKGDRGRWELAVADDEGAEHLCSVLRDWAWINGSPADLTAAREAGGGVFFW